VVDIGGPKGYTFRGVAAGAAADYVLTGQVGESFTGESAAWRL
jgi:hypothetical protein